MSDFGEVRCIELMGFGKVMKILFLFCSSFRIFPIYIVTVTNLGVVLKVLQLSLTTWLHSPISHMFEFNCREDNTVCTV